MRNRESVAEPRTKPRTAPRTLGDRRKTNPPLRRLRVPRTQAMGQYNGSFNPTTSDLTNLHVVAMKGQAKIIDFGQSPAGENLMRTVAINAVLGKTILVNVSILNLAVLAR